MKNKNKDPIDLLQEEISRNMTKVYSEKTLLYAQNPVNMGRMNDPTGAAWIKGICGDTIEIYLIIKDNRIIDTSFFTDGCGVTVACGSVITELAKNKTIESALSISPKSVIDSLENLPRENIHCAILAVSTLHKAIADYLLKY